MKIDSKIRNSVVFLDLPIIFKWSELIYWLLLQITAWSLILDWGGLERGWPVLKPAAQQRERIGSYWRILCNEPHSYGNSIYIPR